MNDNTRTSLGFIIMFLVIISFVSLWSNIQLHDKLDSQKRELDWYGTNYLDKQGGTSLWPGSISTNKWMDYHLRSFDAGKTWYAIHTTEKNEVIVDGPVETVYPGLMKTLQDWDNILSYAEKHGPINPNNQEDLKVLESNGFTVQRTTN